MDFNFVYIFITNDICSLIIALIVSINSFSVAQTSLCGYVYDNKQNHIPFATVRLLQQDSTYIQGCTTDSIGKYTFDNISKGNYLVSFSCIGYDSETIAATVNNDTILNAILTENTKQLGEVTVYAEPIIRLDNKLIIRPSQQQTKHSSTGYDLLYNLMIPGIDVNRSTGDVSAFNGSVTLYINGVKSTYLEVKNLRPRDVEKIEYIDAPSGKYAGDNAAIN